MDALVTANRVAASLGRLDELPASTQVAIGETPGAPDRPGRNPSRPHAHL